ncbi:hypothetical protein DMUE_1011 [Dictyocoela muelleri]|nr:hypothetical protein DMUE_1011 [Dictyocoela muelleri]
MWSENLVNSFFERYILSRFETRFAHEPTLVIIDSFSAHLKVDKKYKKQNVFIIFVPKGTTPLLQMLDVSINRSFQQYFDDKINEWIYETIEDKENRTKNGNIKKPSYKLLTDICWDFMRSMDKNIITKSFEICGILGDSFDIHRLHEPLKQLLLGEELNEILFLNDTILMEEEVFNDNLKDWLFIGKDSCTFFKILLLILYDAIDFHLDIRKNISDKLETIEELNNLYDDDYVNEIRSSVIPESELVIFAASNIYNININLYYGEDIKNRSFRYQGSRQKKEYDILKIFKYFLIKKVIFNF